MKKKYFWIIGIIILVTILLTYFYHSESKFVNNRTYCEADNDCHEYGCGGCSLDCENRYFNYNFECSAVCIRTEMTCRCEKNQCTLRYSNVTATCHDICNQWSNPNTYNCSSDDRHMNFSSLWNELDCSLYLTCECVKGTCDEICIDRGFIEGFCESGPGIFVDCNGGASIGQTSDCRLEGTSGGGWKACCCYYGE